MLSAELVRVSGQLSENLKMNKNLGKMILDHFCGKKIFIKFLVDFQNIFVVAI